MNEQQRMKNQFRRKTTDKTIKQPQFHLGVFNHLNNHSTIHANNRIESWMLVTVSHVSDRMYDGRYQHMVNLSSLWANVQTHATLFVTPV